jgi:acyl carrier protein
MIVPIVETQLVDDVIQWIHSSRAVSGRSEVEITGETDLLATGIVDSFGFVELILCVEEKSGSKVDLSDVDPAEFSTVSGLCRIALRNHSNG